MSAKVKEHFDKLLEVIGEKLSFDHVITVLNLSSNDLYLRSLLYDMRSVLNEKHLDDGSVELKVRMPEHKLKSVIKDINDREVVGYINKCNVIIGLRLNLKIGVGYVME